MSPFKDPAARAAYMREYNRSHPNREGGDRNAQARRRTVRNRVARLADKPFCGVDGEGGNLPDPGTLFGTRHEYLLLRAGSLVLETGNPLSFWECAEFLTSLPVDFTYAAYYFDYDVTMMLKSAPVDRVKRLFNVQGNIGDVEIGPYLVGYMPGKSFRIKRKIDPTPALVINDMGPFFQCSFVKALTDWNIGTAEQRAKILEGKSKRSGFAAMTGEDREYNRLEVELFEQLATEFGETCADLDIVPSRWQGPGQIASAVLKKNNVPRQKDIPICQNTMLMGLANDAYYGGRFENTALGPIGQSIYQYDINSAYPHAMRSLPCLLHGSFRKTRTRPEGSEQLWFGRVAHVHSPGSMLAHLPSRTREGGLVFPLSGSGVYWSVEVEAAERAGATIDFAEGYVYEKSKTCSCVPFDFVQEMYTQRKALGKSARGLVLKLGMNSLYGKLAQSIGSPPYANPLWASLITAITRAMIADACALNPGAIISVATDAVFSLVPLALDCGTSLGQWEETLHPNGMFLVQPGVYFSGDLSQKSKSRGVNLTVLEDGKELFETCFEELRGDQWRFAHHKVSLEVTRFISMRQALAWNRPEKAGSWPTDPRNISFEIRPKRDQVPRLVDGVWRTRPPEGSPLTQSVPYGKVIGGGRNMNAERAVRWEQPDFSEFFLAR